MVLFHVATCLCLHFGVGDFRVVFFKSLVFDLYALSWDIIHCALLLMGAFGVAWGRLGGHSAGLGFGWGWIWVRIWWLMQ